MPATPARIGFLQSQFRKVIAKDSAIQSTYGQLARDSEDPIEAFFSSEADALVVVNERQALLGEPRRRFSVTVIDALDLWDRLQAGTVPTVRLVDQQRSCDRTMAITAAAFDFGRGSANLTLWG